jgi:AraC-like DNA-binding protein
VDPEALLRGAAAGAALLVVLTSLPLHGQPLRAARAAFGTGLAAYAVISGGPVTLPQPVVVLFGALAALNPALLWWAGLETFDEAAPVRRWVLPAAAACLTLAIGALWVPAAGWLRAALAAGLYLHLLLAVQGGRQADLVEPRRRARRAFVVVGAAAGLAVTAGEIALAGHPPAPGLALAQAAGLAAVTLGFATWFLPREAAFHAAPGTAAAPQAGAADLTAAEQAVLARLDAAMAAGIWREEGLTVRALADRLGTAEHRLRRVINGGLGQRNFARFINEHRVTAACAALADPDRADVPVLTIAHESGFASLGPFNRAFREITGQSPSAYRAAAAAARKG